MNRFSTFSLAVAAGLVLSACAGNPEIERDAAVALPPMPKPATVPADVRLTNWGEPYRVEVVGGEGDSVTRRVAEGRNTGCTYTNDGWFSPNTDFRNCDGHSGTNEFSSSGELWPLAVGKTQVYRVTSSDGSQDTRRCAVKSAVVVRLQGRELPSYEVVCSSTWSTWIWYVSPELGMPVKYRLFQNRDGLVDDVEVVLD